ncbi:MAG: hypothetical protein H7Y07_06370 [Pyrinomonadaceae bacterium]|nr:hypothetical protein [Sphingobacteriaceae bacterium]
MISIIICSKDRKMLDSISKNVEETIGAPYEIIPIDNSLGKFGICKAYNDGGLKAKYEFLCFMHEDIFFETNDWGSKVINHLQDKSVGLIGVLGGDGKPKVPVSWVAGDFCDMEAHMIVHYPDENKTPGVLVPQFSLLTASPDDTSPIKQVACIDGVWMCTRKDVFEKFKFDDKTLEGFHAYDIDYSLQVLTEFKVCVVFDVLLHHYSMGNFDKKFMNHKIKLNYKWRKKLPLSLKNLSEDDYLKQHWLAMDVFINKLIQLDYKLLFILKQHLVFSSNRFFRIKPFLIILRSIILKKGLRLK